MNEKTNNVILTCEDDKEYICITEDQLRLLKWLKDKEWLSFGTDVEVVETTIFQKI